MNGVGSVLICPTVTRYVREAWPALDVRRVIRRASAGGQVTVMIAAGQVLPDGLCADLLEVVVDRQLRSGPRAVIQDTALLPQVATLVAGLDPRSIEIVDATVLGPLLARVGRDMGRAVHVALHQEDWSRASAHILRHLARRTSFDRCGTIVERLLFSLTRADSIVTDDMDAYRALRAVPDAPTVMLEPTISTLYEMRSFALNDGAAEPVALCAKYDAEESRAARLLTRAAAAGWDVSHEFRTAGAGMRADGSILIPTIAAFPEVAGPRLLKAARMAVLAGSPEPAVEVRTELAACVTKLGILGILPIFPDGVVLDAFPRRLADAIEELEFELDYTPERLFSYSTRAIVVMAESFRRAVCQMVGPGQLLERNVVEVAV